METNSTVGALIAVGMVLLILLMVGGAVYSSIRAARRQKEEMLARGLVPQAQPDPALEARIRVLHPGTNLRNVYLLNRGAYQLYLFELWGSSKHEDSPRSTRTMALLSPDFRLPRFVLFPNLKMPVLGRVMDWVKQQIIQQFGLQAYEFPECPAFGEAYLLLGDDENALRGFFDLERLNRLAQLKYFSVEAQGDLVTFSRLDEISKNSNNSQPKDPVGALLTGAAELYSILR